MLLASIDAVAATTTTAAAVTAAALAASVSSASVAAAASAAAIAAAVAACNGETIVIAIRQGGSCAIVAVRTDAGQAVARGRRAR